MLTGVWVAGHLTPLAMRFGVVRVEQTPDTWLPELEPARSALAAGEPVMLAAVRAAMGTYLAAARAAVLRHDTTAVEAIVAAGGELPPNLDAWPPRAVWDAAVAQEIPAAAAATWRAGWAAALTAEQVAVVVSDSARLAAHLADLSARLTGATWPDEVYNAVRAAVTDSIAADEPLSATRARIGQVMHLDPWESRVFTIARTELHAAYSAGSYQAGLARAEDFGEELSRVWLSTTDSRCRPAHELANGAVAGPGEAFTVGGEPMMFPHDPRGSAGNTINCRCTLLWVDAEEAAAARSTYQQYQQSMTTQEGPAVTTAAATTVTIDIDTAPPEPTAAVADTAPADTAAQPSAGPPAGTRWSGPLMALEHRTGDSTLAQRVMGIPTDGYRVTNHPWLSYQKASAPNHSGKITVGRPEVLWVANYDLDGQQVPHLWGAGTLDDADPDAVELARKLRDGFAGTVSADLDDAQSEIRWMDDAGNQVPEPDEDRFMDWMMGVDIGADPVEYFHTWRFAGVTLVQDPAFHTGWIQCTDADLSQLAVGTSIWRRSEQPAMVASAALLTVEVTGTPGSTAWCQRVAELAAVTEPTSEYFRDPQLTGPTKVTISDDGRWVFGHVADWDTIHTVYGCPPPRCPHGGTYPRFHRHPVHTTDGAVILTGPLTADGHASTDEGVTLAAAQLHYDNPDFILADTVARMDRWGISISGVPRPGVSAAGVMFLHRYSFSGDWRENDMIAACACSTPAFHLAHDPEVVSLVASAGARRPRLAPMRTRMRYHRDGSIAALVASGVVGYGPKPKRASDRVTGRRGPGLGWEMYRGMAEAAVIDARVRAAAARVALNPVG